LIDYFALALVHALLALAFIRMARRDALDREDEGAQADEARKTATTAGPQTGEGAAR